MENSKIILINKRKGISSHKLIKEVQKKYNFHKIGHAGTLDPMAEGLVIAMSNNATKLSDILMKKDKVYYVKMQLGYETDTLDADGKTIDRKSFDVNIEKINEVILTFIGKIKQKPPIYSAIKVNGRKLYQFARNNENIEIKEREIEIYSITDVELNDNIISFRAYVSSGTYIRSLVRDIAYKLNTCATMVYLLREKISDFNVPNDISIFDVPEFMELDNIYLNSKEEVNKLLNGLSIYKNCSGEKMYHCYYNTQYLGIIDVVDKNKLKKSKFFVKRENYEKN